ncbi:MAG: CorA family divalent cation transporter [Patescibacteria group bacterium]|jgi:magnesium transporter
MSKIQTLNIKGLRNKKISWLNIVNAQGAEIDYLRKKYNFSPNDLRDAHVSIVNFHVKINAGKNYLFIALRFPYFNKEEQTINSTEIDFFAGKDYIVMLHEGKIPALKKMFADYEKNNGKNTHNIDSSVDLFYKIIDALLDDGFDLLDYISKETDEIEDLIFAWESKKAIASLLNLRRSAINIRTITKNYQNILEKFKKLAPEAGIIDKRTPYTSVVEKSKDLINMIENRKEMIEALYASNESIMNYRMNDVMKTLTIFSVIVFPLTLLAAVFGMNTMNSMPFVDNPHDFWIIVIIMLGGCMAMLGFFKWKKWI